jgi:hypothetical protein
MTDLLPKRGLVITMKVRCKNVLPIDKEDPRYPNLTLGNIYNVIEGGGKTAYVIIGNEGSPYFFDKRRFDIVDPTMDEDWIVEINDEGDVCFYSKELSQYEYLYEDYHDDNLEIIKAFDDYVLKKFNKEIGELEGIVNHPERHTLKESVKSNFVEYSREELRSVRKHTARIFNNVTVMDVKCINNQSMINSAFRHPDITEGNLYSILGMEGDYYRILGDTGKPYLYHKNRFEVIACEKGMDWTREIDSVIGEICYPAAITVNIFEEFFLYDLKAKVIISSYVNKIFDKKFHKLYDPSLSMMG